MTAASRPDANGSKGVPTGRQREQGRRAPVRQISEIANALIDPVLTRRAGIDTLLLGAWEDIVGEALADCTRPEAIRWPRPAGGRRRRDRADAGQDRAEPDIGFSPGTLTIACDGARAVFVAHAGDELKQRVNAFFGFPAIGAVRIVQKPVQPQPTGLRRSGAASMSPEAAARLDAMLADVDDVKLRSALQRLGREVLARSRFSGGT